MLGTGHHVVEMFTITVSQGAYFSPKMFSSFYRSSRDIMHFLV